jgi:pSer/pThr/pTyr-binding forkhead associated (FHA) protein
VAPLGFIEILDGRGNVDERVPVEAFPIRLGRAYSNQVVINDPYVCPVHALIEADERGRLLVRDLDSVNGLHSAIYNRRIKSLELQSGTQFRLGRTLLRFCSVDHPLAPTLIDREHKYTSPQSPYVAIIVGPRCFLAAYLGFLSRQR